MNFSGLAFLRPPAFQEILNPVKFTQIPKSLMETKGGLVIFCWKVGRLPAFWNAARPKKKKIFCGQNHVLVVLERQVKIRHFRGKKKAFKNSLETIFIPKSGRGRVTLTFHLLFSLPTKRERGRWFIFKLLFLLQMQANYFPQSWLELCVLGQLWEPLSAPAMRK